MQILIDIDNTDRILIIKFIQQQRNKMSDVPLSHALRVLLEQLGYTWCDDDIKIDD